MDSVTDFAVFVVGSVSIEVNVSVFSPPSSPGILDNPIFRSIPDQKHSVIHANISAATEHIFSVRVVGAPTSGR